MMSNYTICPAMNPTTISKITDEKELEALLNKQSFNYVFDQALVDSLKTYFKQVDSLFLIARDDAEFAGFCCIDRDWWEDNFFFIREILVDAHFQKCGIGEELMRQCIEHAKSRGAVGVVTETAFENYPMQALCEKMGFVKWENPQWIEGVTYKLVF